MVLARITSGSRATSSLAKLAACLRSPVVRSHVNRQVTPLGPNLAMLCSLFLLEGDKAQLRLRVALSVAHQHTDTPRGLSGCCARSESSALTYTVASHRAHELPSIHHLITSSTIDGGESRERSLNNPEKSITVNHLLDEGSVMIVRLYGELSPTNERLLLAERAH